MSKKKRHPDEETSIEQALFEFDQRLELPGSNVSGPGFERFETPLAADTEGVLKENLETLRLLDAVRIAEQAPVEAVHKIGRFEVVRELGRGGYGVVLLARDPRLNRLVALKVPRPEAIVTEDLRERFLREAEAAAALNHPNILPIFEQGAAGPICYIAMALCQGPSLLEWVRERGAIEPKAAARVVAILADAVQHAHNRGVLHRDIKPANVLIDVQDDAANGGADTDELLDAIRLTDFGLARLGEDGGHTKTGAILGTPLYMSPEQTLGQPARVGQATDIYALGATLYFLLAGRPPLQGDNEVQTMMAIQNLDPAAPSQHVAHISKDLDAICLKCLEKNPELRYRTATQLAADLQRYLDSVPVQARQITLLVRSGRWCSRNPLLAAAAALVAVVMTGSFLWINHERNMAESAAVRANLSAKRSLDSLKVLTDSFESVDPYAGATPDLSAKEVLVNATKSLHESELDAEGKAKLLGSLIACYFGLGEYQAALPIATENFAIRCRLFGVDDPATLAGEHDLGTAYLQAGEFDKAESTLQEAFEFRRTRLGESHEDTLATLHTLADTHRQMGHWEQAIMLFDQVLQARQATLGPNHFDTLMSLTSLAHAKMMAGNIKDAIPLHEEAVRAFSNEIGPEHPHTLTAQHKLAWAYMSDGRLAEAIELYELTLATRRRVLGADHAITITSLGSLAHAYMQAGRLAEAIEMNKQTLDAYILMYGEDSPHTIVPLNNLAYAYQLSEKYDDALLYFEQTYALAIDQLGEEHPTSLIATKNYGVAHINVENYVAAEPFLRDCLAIVEKRQTGQWGGFSLQSILGEALLGQQKLKEAGELLSAGYAGLLEQADSIPGSKRQQQLQQAMERLVRLAQAQQDDEAVEKWQSELDELTASTEPSN